MLSVEEIVQALGSGYELRGLELKTAGPRTDSHLFAKVTRAAIGMANLRDGGHIIIGIDDTDPAAMLPGLSSADLSSWLAYDDVARKLATYADPPRAFDTASRIMPNGAELAVIQVHEFSDIPILCGKDYPDILRKGACFVRSRRVPETSEIPSSTEMRDLLQLGTEKALRAHVEIAARAGVLLVPASSSEPPDAERFDEQRRRAW